MSIIEKNILHKDFVLNVLNQVDGSILTYSRNEIIEFINRTKTYLIKEKNAKAGQKVLLLTNSYPDYIVWFFSAAELGMSFVVSDFPLIDNSLSVRNKLSLYGNIDHVISYDSSNPFMSRMPEFNDERVVNPRIFRKYTDSELGDVCYATPDTPLVQATTSGSTNLPRVVTYTHEFFSKILDRNAKLYNMHDDDYCFHSKGLHHGSVTSVYFLPAVKYCRRHLGMSAMSVTPDWVKTIQEEKITRCLCFYDTIDRLVNDLSIDRKKHNDLTVYVLYRITKKQIDTIVKKFGYKIVSIFGCTETGGPLFVPEVNLQNADSFNDSDMGEVPDDFYKITLNQEQLLTVTLPTGEVVCTGDKFELVNNRFIFKGRENRYRINDIPIYLDLLIEVVERLTGLKNGQDIDVVVDQREQKIYIRSDSDLDLNAINSQILELVQKSEYTISKKIIGPRLDFFTGIKLDAEEIRIRCRNL